MTRWCLHAAGAVLAVIATACGGATTAPDGVTTTAAATEAVTPTGVAASIVDLTNQERATAGVGMLQANARLMQAAQLQADQVARLGQLEHVLPAATYPRPEDRLAVAGYTWRAYGENLASGQRTPAEAMRDWMQSTGHRENILNPVFTEIGIGYAIGAGGRPYYVQVFGRPL